MTGTTALPVRTDRLSGAIRLAVALAVGASIGSIATLQVIGQSGPPAAAAPAVVDAGVAAVHRATTTATEQYVGWYMRESDGAASWLRESRQYTDWYLRPTNLAGSTTATEQYVNWYMRDDR